MDPATGGCLYILADRMALVCHVAFRPDGRLLATGSTDATVKDGIRLPVTACIPWQGHPNLFTVWPSAQTDGY